ncbi:MAG TPA: HAMP domain-containing sensor histidine kinase [Anaerolineae bacterium]|nr:HAMP domain-containing histidine kinase [Anaerolineae bacterium]MCB9106709.1 HAMP domain-containing histidine kinase [Anaerolineales bacterium]HRV90679.1 HAMP domain-containing sensor histidine kinase [Anaerolineae bacterium]
MTEPNLQPNQFFIQNPTGSASSRPLELRHLSHDLRGPLNSILGFSELLLDGVEGPLTDLQTEDISAIRQSAKHLMWLINTVVDLSKLAADELKFDMVDIFLPDVIQKLVPLIKREMSVEITIDIPNVIPMVRGDSDRIDQIVLNVSRFLIDQEKVKKIRLIVEPNETDVTLRMIAPNLFLPTPKLDEIFELAVHTDAQGHSKLSYGGVALPLAWQLAARHQGSLRVESREETGTCFFLKLPIAAASPAQK